jgi:leucine dehydrogenase
MMADVFEEMATCGAHRVIVLHDDASGLRAMIALDDVALGPACGGIRTRPYPATLDALRDVTELAAAMTLKCAIAGLDAGGGKTVVIERPGMDRAAAFRRLGDHIDDLGGLYRAAGDLGTTQDDLLHVAERTTFVNTTGEQLGAATGDGIVNCIRACARHRGIGDLSGLHVAVQGCGLIGAGVARSMVSVGARVTVADVDEARARALADEIGAAWVPSAAILFVDADIVSPCAVGGVLTPAVVRELRAWAVCGGANNQLADRSVDALLAEREITYVPDFLASAGAVIDGAARTVMGVDPAPFIARLEHTASEVFDRARADGSGTDAAARLMARARIDDASRDKAGEVVDQVERDAACSPASQPNVTARPSVVPPPQ